MKKVYLLLVIGLVTLSLSTHAQKKKILFVGAAQATEQGIIDALEGTGLFTVTFLDQLTLKDDTTFKHVEAYDTVDAVFFGESPGSGNVTNIKSAGFPKPMVSLECYPLWSSTKWDFIPANTAVKHTVSLFPKNIVIGEMVPENYRTMKVTDATHPIINACGYTAGQEVLWSDTVRSGGTGGAHLQVFSLEDAIEADIADAATQLGQTIYEPVGDTGTFWAIEGNAIYENRMVIWGVHAEIYQNGANAEFYKILINSLKWVLDMPFTSSIKDNESNNFNISVIDRGSKADIYFNLTGPSQVDVNVYDVLGHSISSINLSGINGQNIYSFSKNNLKGMYFISVETDGITEVKKAVF